MVTRSGGRPALEGGLLPLPRLLWLLAFVVMLDGRTMTTVLPDIAADLGVSVPTAGIAITAYLIPYGVCQLAWGPLADRVGPMRVISVAIVAFVLVVASATVAGSLPALAAIRLVTGGIAAAFFPLALVTLGELVPYGRRQAEIAKLNAATATGVLLGAALGGILTDLFSWRAIFVVDAGLATLLVLPLWRVRDAVPPRGRQPSQRGAILRDRRALAIYGLVAVEGFAFFGGNSYLGALLHDRHGLSYAWTGAVLAVEALASVITARFVGRLLQRIGERWMLLTGGVAMGGGFVIAAAAPGWALVLPGMALIGAGFPVCHSVLQTRGTEIAPEARGTAISFFVFALFVGGAIGTAVLGVVLDAYGFGAALGLAGVLLIAFAYAASRTSSPRSSRNVSTA
jgi:predicted MFS family arabinose efflux permease